MISVQRFLRVSQKIQLELSRRNIHIIKPNKIYVLSIQNKDVIPVPQRSISFIQPDTVRKFLKSIPFLGINKTRMRAVAYTHFETLVDVVDYTEFFDELDLPDTFYSWFVVMELHLWMLSVRAMMDGDEGRLIRNALVEALWADVLQRVKKLDPKSNSANIRTKIVELSEQLQASYISYDEGLNSDDIVLAGALWRRLYQQSDIDMEHLVKLVKYIRKNMRALESMSTEQFHDAKSINWGSITT